MNSIERRNEIMRMLKKWGTADVQTLAERTGVSKMTIRNDLVFLADQGMIVRTYGGAVLANQKDMVRLVSNVLNEYQAQKKGIASEAAKLVCGGMRVLIDTGSTTFQLVPFLKDIPITIVTNSLLVAGRISADSIPDLIVVGGDLSKYCMGFVGSMALSGLEKIYADVLFLGAAGYSIKDNVLTCENLQEAAVKKCMIEHARKVVLLADSSKHERRGFVAYAKMEDIDVLVTDRMDSKDINELKGMDVDVIVAGTAAN
jgi:DeoR/GlpR family transcriptional regulator of sugar metabolism